MESEFKFNMLIAEINSQCKFIQGTMRKAPFLSITTNYVMISEQIENEVARINGKDLVVKVINSDYATALTTLLKIFKEQLSIKHEQ